MLPVDRNGFTTERHNLAPLFLVRIVSFRFGGVYSDPFRILSRRIAVRPSVRDLVRLSLPGHECLLHLRFEYARHRNLAAFRRSQDLRVQEFVVKADAYRIDASVAVINAVDPAPTRSPLSWRSQNQTGNWNTLRPRPYGLFLDDLPIHIRPDLPATRVQNSTTPMGSSHYGASMIASSALRRQ